MKSKGSGKIDIMTMVGIVKKNITLNNVLYVPDWLYNVGPCQNHESSTSRSYSIMTRIWRAREWWSSLKNHLVR